MTDPSAEAAIEFPKSKRLPRVGSIRVGSGQAASDRVKSVLIWLGRIGSGVLRSGRVFCGSGWVGIYALVHNFGFQYGKLAVDFTVGNDSHIV